MKRLIFISLVLGAAVSLYAGGYDGTRGVKYTTVSSDSAGTALSADSLAHKLPDFDVDLLAESLAVKAPLASPAFTTSDTGVIAVRSTGKIGIVQVAKDTTLEVALFTRTCTRDTLAFMTGADSLTAAYIVNAFATRGAITVTPYIAGIVGGKLVVDRPAADTASYDRYSVTKFLQR